MCTYAHDCVIELVSVCMCMCGCVERMCICVRAWPNPSSIQYTTRKHKIHTRTHIVRGTEGISVQEVREGEPLSASLQWFVYVSPSIYLSIYLSSFNLYLPHAPPTHFSDTFSWRHGWEISTDDLSDNCNFPKLFRPRVALVTALGKHTHLHNTAHTWNYTYAHTHSQEHAYFALEPTHVLIACICNTSFLWSTYISTHTLTPKYPHTRRYNIWPSPSSLCFSPST